MLISHCLTAVSTHLETTLHPVAPTQLPEFPNPVFNPSVTSLLGSLPEPGVGRGSEANFESWDDCD